MKYPKVLFYRNVKHKHEVDDFIENNREKFDCTIEITENAADIQKLFSENYHILVTYGDSDECIKEVNKHMVDRFYSRWIHKTSIQDIKLFSYNVTYCYINNAIQPRVSTRSKFSIFTSCYNSYEKILRAYEGVKSQKLKDWEWVIMDDSPDDKHFEYIKKIFQNDKRVRLYKRACNSGNIGNVKNETIGLCRGKYIIELDHDDVILPDCLIDAFKVFEKDEEVGFIYMHSTNIGEDYSNFSYGDFICKGYGGYITQKVNGHWFNVYLTPNINNITLSHLVCCPNHPRIWRRKTLMELGSFNEMLPICDDYEIILKSCINTKVVKIDKLAYIQFLNNNNNNFSLIRNGEINRIGPNYISTQFYEKYNVDEVMKEKNGFEDIQYRKSCSQIWKRNNYCHKYSNEIVNVDYTKQICMIGIENLDDPEIYELYKDKLNDFIVLDNNVTTQKIQMILESKDYDRMKCYAMSDCSDIELERYFLLLYKNIDNYKIYNRRINL